MLCDEGYDESMCRGPRTSTSQAASYVQGGGPGRVLSRTVSGNAAQKNHLDGISQATHFSAGDGLMSGTHDVRILHPGVLYLLQLRSERMELSGANNLLRGEK